MVKKYLVPALIIGITLAFPNPDSKAISQQNATAVVKTSLGSIQGTSITSRLGKQIFAFRGIPYAKAPINELRFQPPVPSEKWEGTRNATVDGPACPQFGVTPTSEDCLLLNVYSTKLPRGTETDKRPVLVFFHGGGFHSGSGCSGKFGPKYLLDQDIVLVVPNYRLGAFGFLSTGDKEAPGNLGLKDQVEALKWVKEYISAFGGDPNDVTIAGFDAGAASVTLHLISPLSQGLFHKAIAMSGSGLGSWPLTKGQLDLSKKQARFLNCTDDSSTNILKCLRSKTADEIVETTPKFKEFGNLDPYYIWLPVIEDDFGQQRFLIEHPIESVLEGKFAKVPFLTGLTTDEFVKHAFNVVQSPNLMDEIGREFERVGPIALVYERETNYSKAISNELRKFYFENKLLVNSSVPTIVELYSDGLVGFGVNRAATLIAQKSNESVYFYRFNYKGRHSFFYLPDSNKTVPYGVAHGDDLIYLFHNPTDFADYKESDPEVATVEKMTALWCNFVQKGNPIPEPTDKLDNVKWEPFTVKTKKYMEIGNKLVLNENLNEKRYTEWENLFPLYKYQKNVKQHG